MNNVENIELFFSREKGEDNNLKEERNKIKLKNELFLNEIEISEKIKKMPEYLNYFDVFTDYSNMVFGELNEITELNEMSDLNEITKLRENNAGLDEKFAIVNYKSGFYIDFYDFFLNLPTAKLFIFHIIDSFSYLIKSLLILNTNNICFLNLSAENIVFNGISLKPLLHNFEYGLYIKHINVDYLCQIINKLDDLSDKPLDIHVIFYLIRNNERTLSYSIITEICDNYVKNLKVLDLFSQKHKEFFKNECIESLKKFINKPKTEIINELLTFMSSWDNYCISILFLHIVTNTIHTFSLKDTFMNKFLVLINKNIHPDFNQRESLQGTIAQFDALFEEFPDWSFINSISDEKMELLVDLLYF
jgi:hypothetical protein